jgi:hypothetical protein
MVRLLLRLLQEARQYFGRTFARGERTIRYCRMRGFGETITFRQIICIDVLPLQFFPCPCLAPAWSDEKAHPYSGWIMMRFLPSGHQARPIAVLVGDA